MNESFTGTVKQTEPLATAEPSAEEVLVHLQKMLNSRIFRRSPRMSQFLKYTVEEALEGQQDKLKEYSIGVAVFHRPESFDPRLDSIVRVEARRLRAIVEQYYETEGKDDPLLIMYRPGSYIPVFRWRQARANRDNIMFLVGSLPADDPRCAELIEMLSNWFGSSVRHLNQSPSSEAMQELASSEPRFLVFRPAGAEEVDEVGHMAAGGLWTHAFPK
ncbi:MAG: hypothetical protein HYZ57_09620 [Acidobacteria bacterium]|nr:hypothetical protein [Acidobacteriota bacterium]